mmetsp:Transcript_118672/g.335656  ORF Transcript_118672/g.335656 Transcript_118672/m.335656 type:complete len:257 (+) Transcript_118672:227-997(+)
MRLALERERRIRRIVPAANLRVNRLLERYAGGAKEGARVAPNKLVDERFCWHQDRTPHRVDVGQAKRVGNVREHCHSAVARNLGVAQRRHVRHAGEPALERWRLGLQQSKHSTERWPPRQGRAEDEHCVQRRCVGCTGQSVESEEGHVWRPRARLEREHLRGYARSRAERASRRRVRDECADKRPEAGHLTIAEDVKIHQKAHGASSRACARQEALAAPGGVQEHAEPQWFAAHDNLRSPQEWFTRRIRADRHDCR